MWNKEPQKLFQKATASLYNKLALSMSVFINRSFQISSAEENWYLIVWIIGGYSEGTSFM